ncbi:MAG: iron-sulfur cluster assembly protein, partial [Thermoplasmata archaeon]
MPSEDDVMTVLRKCYDPEIPINIVDLGLVYDIELKDDKVHVKMTLTAPGCPMHTMISEDVTRKLLTLD